MNESLFDLKKNAFKTLVNFVSTVKPKLFRKIKDLQKRVVKSSSQRIGIAEGGIFRVPSAGTEADYFLLPKITFVA